MKKSKLFAVVFAAALVGCSSDSLVDNSVEKKTKEVPIGFSVQKQNITRAANLEAVNHYNFGVWAYKVSAVAKADGVTDPAEIMNNYLVGFGGTNVGYNYEGATTWAATAGSDTDHTSPWFYEGLGTAEYTYEGSAGYYKKTDAAYMSNNTNQYLRYWDLAYAKTNFYCYAPYNKTVSFTKDATTSYITFPAKTSIRDGYVLPQNTAYAAYDRSLSEFMYAGVQAANGNLADVTIPFKHTGAQLLIRFYEDIPGYKVEIIDLSEDINGGSTDYSKNGIQATPAKYESSAYASSSYYTTSGGKVNFTEAKAGQTDYAAFAPDWTGSTTDTTPLMFKIPSKETDYLTYSVAPGNLTQLGTTSHYYIKEKATGEGTQEYSYSPTIYYPVAQPTTSKTGFTFHVTYRIIADDNNEVITIHDARVFVPTTGNAKVGTDDATATAATATADQYITLWQPNVKYTYTFKITKDATGTTSPATDPDPTAVDPGTKKSLYPIVFDAATIEDFTSNMSEYEISTGTSY